MIRALAALSAAIAVGASAFGAHGADGEAAEWLRTGGLYQLIHGVAIFVLADRHAAPARAMLGGATVFAVTLYLMALGAPRWLGAITPIGGAMMIGAWVWIAWAELRRV